MANEGITMYALVGWGTPIEEAEVLSAGGSRGDYLKRLREQVKQLETGKLALMAFMLPNHDHTTREILFSSMSFGLDYEPLVNPMDTVKYFVVNKNSWGETRSKEFGHVCNEEMLKGLIGHVVRKQPFERSLGPISVASKLRHSHSFIAEIGDYDSEGGDEARERRKRAVAGIKRSKTYTN